MIRIQDNLEKSNDTVKPKHKVYNIRSYIVKNQQKLTSFLQKLVNDLEELLYRIFNVQKFSQINKILSGTQITMPNKSQAKVQMCLLKIWDKNTFQRIIFIADNSREQCFELFLSNTFETYGPRQSKVKAMGHTQIQYDNVCQKLGLNVSSLDQVDYPLICNILCNFYTVLTFTKELDADDQERFKENAIMPVDLSCECNCRMFLTNQNSLYKIPLTMSYLGIQDKPIGVRVQIYDAHTNTEQGMFLSISKETWDKLEIQVKGKHSRKYALQNKMSSEYHLPQILQNGGFQVIKEKLTVEDSKTYRIIHGKHISFVDRLENVLNSYSLLEYLNKKLQS